MVGSKGSGVTSPKTRERSEKDFTRGVCQLHKTCKTNFDELKFGKRFVRTPSSYRVTHLAVYGHHGQVRRPRDAPAAGQSLAFTRHAQVVFCASIETFETRGKTRDFEQVVRETRW